MNKYETIRLHGEPVEVALHTGVPMYRITDVAGIMGYASATAFVLHMRTKVSLSEYLFIHPMTLGGDLENTVKLVHASSAPAMMKRLVVNWLREEDTRLAEAAAKFAGPQITIRPELADKMLTIREFLAYNNIDLSDRVCTRFGKRAVSRTNGLRRPLGKREIFIEVGDLTFKTRLENTYTYDTLAQVFKDLTK